MKGCAGLGNRLVTVYAALQYSKATHRSIVVDWTDGQFDKKGVDAFEKCFELKDANKTELSELTSWLELSHSSELFKENRFEGVYDLYLDTQSIFWSRLPSKLFFSQGLRKLRRRWQPIKNGAFTNSLSFGSDLSQARTEDILYYVDSLPYLDYTGISNAIQLKAQLIDKLNAIEKQLSISKTVGVHVRNTDKRPTKNILTIIQHLKVKHPAAPIYLSTDSKEVEEMFAKHLPNIIFYPKHKPELNGEGLHQWALYNKKDDQKYQLYEESVIEMFLLSRCEYLYYQGNSTFSSISKAYHKNTANCYNWLQLS